MYLLSRSLFVLLASLAWPTIGLAFPIVAVGDTFTGTIWIDPSTPCSSCIVSSSTVYETFSNAGSISIDLAGTHFAGSSLYIEVSFEDTPGGQLGQWAGYTPKLSGGIQVLLDGSYRSTSILPLDLSQYQPLPPINQISFNEADSTGAQYSYAGNFTSLTKLDVLGNFAFEGTVTQFEVFSSAVPEASTWVMMIIGFPGIGFLALRRRILMTSDATRPLQASILATRNCLRS